MFLLLQLLLTVNIAIQHEVADGMSRMVNAETQERRELFGKEFNNWVNDRINDAENVGESLEDFGNNLSGGAKNTWNGMSEGAKKAWVATENVAKDGVEAIENIDVEDMVEFVEGVWEMFAGCVDTPECLSDFEIRGCMPNDNSCKITYGKECMNIDQTIGVEGHVSQQREHEMEKFGGVVTEGRVKMYGAAQARFEAGSLLELTLDSNPKVAVTIKAPKVTLEAEVGFEFSGSSSLEIEKKIMLGKQKPVYKRAFMAGPIPVYVQVDVQPVAFLTLEGSVDATGTVSYRFDDFFGLDDDIKIEVSLKDFHATHNLDSLRMNLPQFSSDGFQTTLQLNSEITLGVRVGVEIAVKLYNTVEFNLVPSIGASITVDAEMAAQGNFNGASASAEGTVTFCLEGEFDSYFDWAIPKSQRRGKGRRQLDNLNILKAIEDTCEELSEEILGGNCIADQLLTDVLDVCGVATDILKGLGFPENIWMPSLQVIDIPSFTTPDVCFDTPFSIGASLSFSQAQSRGTPAAPVNSEFVYVGCYVDDWGRDLDHRMLGGRNSPEECSHSCANYAYFGVQNGGECWCGNAYSTAGQYRKVGDNECGNNWRGAAWRNSIYRQTRTTRALYAYVGCYVDDRHRDLNHRMPGGRNSPADCSNACRHYAYFGVQNGGECWCDNAYSTGWQYRKVGDHECRDGRGAAWRNSIYRQTRN